MVEPVENVDADRAFFKYLSYLPAPVVIGAVSLLGDS